MSASDQRPNSTSKTWLRALQLTAPIAQSPKRIFPSVIDELAGKYGERPALLSDGECLSFRALAERSNQYARWACKEGIRKGDAVCLLMPNRPEYLAVWLGITKAGGVVALLNTNLTGRSLAHSIDIVAPRQVIAAAELMDCLESALPYVTCSPGIWTEGDGHPKYSRIEEAIDRFPLGALTSAALPGLTVDDQALFVYTSGTTGMPKAAKISHGRIMQWTHWFAGMMDTLPSDRIYNCLPMYHSVGGIQAPGAILLQGGSVVIREKFSASQFWAEIKRWDCTIVQYIGELCRYLLQTSPTPDEAEHHLRLACGNGLRPDVWREFQNRFAIPRILEFYAATEGAVSLFNAEGEPGAIGRIPSFLGHRSTIALVQFDPETEAPLRGPEGFCVPCGVNQAGEALGPLHSGNGNVHNRFEGYSTPAANEKKILRNVFRAGDAWFRTGDLMRKDERGFFYFVDRIGDTFRWKGENVAASEVSEAICAAPGIQQASVYGVSIPGTDGKAGMAALVPDGQLNLAQLRTELMHRLPPYACPLFLRIRKQMEVTTTFKYTKSELIRQGYDPLLNTDPIYFNHPEQKAYVRLDKGLYEQIAAGQFRL